MMDDTNHHDNNASSSPFSFDLAEESKFHRTFLRTLHGLGVSQRKPSPETVRRYRDLWLPLAEVYHDQCILNEEDAGDTGTAVDGSGEEEDGPRLHSSSGLVVEAIGLVPPSDVAWLWHCHRLAPFRYAEHVRKRRKLRQSSPDIKSNGAASDDVAATAAGSTMVLLLEAEPPFSLQHCHHDSGVIGDAAEAMGCDEGGIMVVPHTASGIAAATNARILWEHLYPSEPFFVPHDDYRIAALVDSVDDGEEYGLLDGFDLVASASRQRTFLWQVSGPRFDDDAFLHDGVSNYAKFLHLRSTSRGQTQTIVPTYQIDLMWHTHILSNLQRYHDDCRRLSGGRTLHHDDSLTDRSVGSNLDVAFHATVALWRETFGSQYAVTGGMYRGEPPSGYYRPDFFSGKEEQLPGLALTDVAAEGPYQHLIGKVGASSTVPDATAAPTAPPAPAAGVSTSGTGTAELGNTYRTTTVETRPGGRVVETVRTFHLDGTSTTTSTTSPQGTSWVPPTGAVPDGSAAFVAANTTTISALPQPTSWVPATHDAPDGLPAFIPAKPRSHVRGQNANPRRINHVFGKGSLGSGYYHVSTHDANQILYQRLCIAQRAKRSDVECATCLTCLCPMVASCKDNRARKEQELEELDDMVAVAKARAGASAPHGAVGLSRDHPRYNDYYDSGGMWIVPLYYCGAAACGGDKIAGGGGACGACGCGGGGCGGGGCGGGGCGGGGCGG